MTSLTGKNRQVLFVLIVAFTAVLWFLLGELEWSVMAHTALRMTVVLVTIAHVFLADQTLAGTQDIGLLSCSQLLNSPKVQLQHMQYFCHAQPLKILWKKKKGYKDCNERLMLRNTKGSKEQKVIQNVKMHSNVRNTFWML